MVKDHSTKVKNLIKKHKNREYQKPTNEKSDTIEAEIVYKPDYTKQGKIKKSDISVQQPQHYPYLPPKQQQK